MIQVSYQELISNFSTCDFQTWVKHDLNVPQTSPLVQTYFKRDLKLCDIKRQFVDTYAQNEQGYKETIEVQSRPFKAVRTKMDINKGQLKISPVGKMELVDATISSNKPKADQHIQEKAWVDGQRVYNLVITDPS